MNDVTDSDGHQFRLDATPEHGNSKRSGWGVVSGKADLLNSQPFQLAKGKYSFVLIIGTITPPEGFVVYERGGNSHYEMFQKTQQKEGEEGYVEERQLVANSQDTVAFLSLRFKPRLHSGESPYNASNKFSVYLGEHTIDTTNTELEIFGEIGNVWRTGAHKNDEYAAASTTTCKPETIRVNVRFKLQVT
jgi:hypothetical protein